jgi:peptidoglycan-associated lipoprotein
MLITRLKNNVYMKLFRVILCGVMMLTALGVNAQSKATKAADAEYANKAYFSAIEKYKKAYSLESAQTQKARIIYQIARCYQQLNDNKMAEEWFLKAINAKHPDNTKYLYLGDAMRNQGKYKEAKVYYKKFSQVSPKDNRGKIGEKACDLAILWLNDPTRYQVDNIMMLNTKQYDFASAYATKRNNAIVFSTSRNSATGDAVDPKVGENYQDLYMASIDKKGKWSEPQLLDPMINSKEHEGAASFDAKGAKIYFTRCVTGKKDAMECDIYESPKVGTAFTEPVKLPIRPAGDDSSSFAHPSITYRGDKLFFTSDMPGGYGGKDIWMIKWDKKAKVWSAPINLGSKINTKGDEMFPYIRKDNVLYFSSTGHPGMGGLDIFKAKPVGDDKWGAAENMKYPINSQGNDYSIHFDGTKEQGMFTSNREGGKGKDDLYSFYLPPLEFTLQGKVLDKEKKSPVAGATVKVVGSDGTSFETLTTETGEFKFAENGTKRFINENTTYSIVVSKKDYLIGKDRISTTGLDESTIFFQEFIIQYSPPFKAVSFPEVQYELGSWELLPNSKDSLEFLYELLVDNHQLTIELQAHTDSRGSEEANLELSQKRAQACVDYLIERGIRKDRMTAKGYGETKLRISDEEIAKLPAAQQEKAHQKNRRTEFAVLRNDYVPSEGVEEPATPQNK